MRKERLYVIFFFIAILLMYNQPVEGKKVIIHVPFRVKNVKHTHTIYKVLPHHHHHLQKQDKHVKEETSEEFDHYKKK